MKKNLLFIFLVMSLVNAFSQADTTQPIHKKFPNFPPFTLLLPDSNSVLIKNQLPIKSPVLLILFHPDCDHCRHETEDITKRINEFEHIQIVMVTPAPYALMKQFWEKYELGMYKNIIVGQDDKMIMPTFFTIRNLPFLAFYNTKKELIETADGQQKVDFILSKFKK